VSCHPSVTCICQPTPCSGTLHLASRADVAQFMAQVRARQAHLLSELTDGLHLHTLAARQRRALERARDILRAKGYLVE
jgi:transcriptional regulator of NAD metabolism